MEQELRRRIDELLARHTTATVSTCGPEGPWAAAVFYVHDQDLSLYFLTDPATRHGRDLVCGGQAAAAIHQDGQDWREIRGLQIVGAAARVRGARATARAWKLYLAKFPFVAQFMAAPGTFLGAYSGAMGKVRFFCLKPSRVWITDNRRSFGLRDVYDLAQPAEDSAPF